MWISPSFAPQTYQFRYSRRSLCTENTPNLNPPFGPVTSPYINTGLSPGSYYVYILFGIYGSDVHQLDNISAITLSSGKV